MEDSKGSTVMKTMQLNDQKAGMQGLDKELINKIIYESSKGTSYFTFQEKRQQSIDSRVKELKSILNKLTDAEKSVSLKRMNALCESLESERDFSHSIVHIDMDAFYAAVEMEDNPSLKGKPMAVGSMSMLSTSNYEARKYGVRAAMPGFIAKKLCPQLTIVPCNFDKYKKVSRVVRSIIEEYDPDYCPASLDEMYFDLTTYIAARYGKNALHAECTSKEGDSEDDCAVLMSRREDLHGDLCTSEEGAAHLSNEERDRIAFALVQEIREKITEKTNLTASAGIAPNVMLAKVGSDQNKPNGQFQIESSAYAVQKFISTLPVKKVSGIGPVQGQILQAVGIETCRDMWEQRHLVGLLFSDTNADFYMRVAMGVGSTQVKSNYVRKSIGAEHTFRETHDPEQLRRKCLELCAEVVEDMKERHLVGKVVVLKIKTAAFDSHTRNQSLAVHSADLDVISGVAKRLLDAEIANAAPDKLTLRLMGIRMSGVASADDVPNHSNIRDFLRPAEADHGRQVQESSPPATNQKEEYRCPVCGSGSFCDLAELNAHVDSCLSRTAIKEMLAEERTKRKVQPDEKHSKKRKMLHNGGKTIQDYFR